MSLKGFHIFFITIATLFCLGFSLWAFYGAGDWSQQMRTPGIVTALVGAAILGYGVWFVKKKASTIIVS
jgi:hypothetical protein